MAPRRSPLLVATGLLFGLAASCADSAAMGDAAAEDDRAPVNDLSTDLGNSTDAGLSADAADARGEDGATMLDVAGPLDVEPDAVIDAGNPWGDATLVDLGNGIVIPIDPNAVPAPGSECTSDASVRAGDPTVAPPRPIRPLSVSRVTSQRPTFQWVLPEGTTGARIEVCADRCCTRVIQTIDAEGTTTRPMTALPPGVVFWRMFGRRAGVVGSRASYTWEFEVRRRDAPNDTTWGTIHDFNGDGFDDAMVFRPRKPGSFASELLFVGGSFAGMQTPVVTDIVTVGAVSRARVGDLDGDGVSDLVWDDREGVRPASSWFNVVSGSSGDLRVRASANFRDFGNCARIGGVAVVDWNGDGYSDVIAIVSFGCDLFIPVEASVLVGFRGSSSGVASIAQWAYQLDGRLAHPFVQVNNAGQFGDVDRDGYGDVFVVSGFSGAGTTSVRDEHAIVHGTSDVIERIVEPSVASAAWGYARFEAVGDMDGDGYLDFRTQGAEHTVVIYRHTDGFSRPSQLLTDPLDGPDFGQYVSSGDINADGLSDIIISSESVGVRGPGGGLVDVGRVYVFPGSATGFRTSVWIERTRGPTSGTELQPWGSNPMCPGDINGDGVDDVIVLDILLRRMCVRSGAPGFASGSPEQCIDDVVPGGSFVY